MSVESAETALIDRACEGDPDAISELYRLYVPAMTRYIGYRVGDAAAVEDLTAEVFLRMIEGLPRYNSRGVPFEAWLYRIASARVADYYRRKKRRPTQSMTPDVQDEVQEIPDDTLPLELNLQQKEEVVRLQTALQKLSEEQQHILILRFVERKSHEEVAEMLGKSVRAVATAQHRALKRLAGFLGTEKDSRHYLRGERES